MAEEPISMNRLTSRHWAVGSCLVSRLGTMSYMACLLLPRIDLHSPGTGSAMYAMTAPSIPYPCIFLPNIWVAGKNPSCYEKLILGRTVSEQGRKTQTKRKRNEEK